MNPRKDMRKQTLYLPEDMLNDVLSEAYRQDRSLSWLLKTAWQIARERVTRFPTAPRHAG